MPPDNSVLGFARFLIEQYGNALLGVIIVLVLLGAGLYIYKQVFRPLIASMLEIETLRATQTASMAQQTINLAEISKTNETIAEHLLAATTKLAEISARVK